MHKNPQSSDSAYPSESLDTGPRHALPPCRRVNMFNAPFPVTDVVPPLQLARIARGYKTAVVAVAHRLCRVLYALLRDRTEFQPTRLGIEEGPFTQTITRRFRLTPKPARDGLRERTFFD